MNRIPAASRSPLSWLFVLAAFFLAGPLSLAHAAITPNGDVSPSNPSTWTVSTNGYIGETAAGSLTVSDGSDLSSHSGYVGYGSGSSGVATITGIGSSWYNSSDLYVGRSGSGTLNVLSGGTVSNSYGYIGYNTGSSGMVTVDGASSKWSNGSYLYVGYSGSGTLNVVSGGTVSASSSYIGFNTGSSGTVTMDGAGSKWSNGSDLYVGYSGSGAMNVQSGAAVRGYAGWIGYNAGSSGTVTVNGAGSTWSNNSELYVGRYGSGTLNIFNGGAVSADRILVSGSTSTINFGTSGGTLTAQTLFASPTQLTGMGKISAKGLVSDLDLVFETSASASFAFGAGGTATVDMSAASGNGELGVGWVTTGTLAIRNGRVVSSWSGLLGYNAGSSGSATVDGAGSKWKNDDELCIGLFGSGTLNILGGATVSSSTSYIGGKTGSSGSVTVDGAGSTWTKSDRANILYIGYSGTGAMTVLRGATVGTYLGYIGYNLGSSGAATVDGAGSTWSSGDVYVGNSGSGTLNIFNGAAVSATGRTYVCGPTSAIDFGASGGTLTTQTLLASQTQLRGVGTISSKGLVSDFDLVFDTGTSLRLSFTFGAGGTATIDMSAASGNGDLGAGWATTGTLMIKNGCSVSSQGGYLGYNAGSSGTATVDGGGSLWSNSSSLYVGRSGSGTLLIAHGGGVSDVYGSIGDSLGSMGEVSIDGAGSKWANDYSIYVGGYGSGTVSATRGGNLITSSGFIARNSGSVGLVRVDGVGSTWTNGSHIKVGHGGRGELSITNGGVVSDDGGYIGGYINSPAGSTGVATVNGTGSTWNHASTLYVGYSGNGTLNIINGGTVNNGDGNIGYSFGSVGNATVDGHDSVWNSRLALVVGSASSQGTLNITNGGAVTANSLSINSGSRVAIDVGRGSLLEIAGGAGTIANSGTVRVLAGAGVPADDTQYSPISAGTWSGTSTAYQAIGGKWNAVNHRFTASSVTSGMSGSAISLNLASVQRALVGDVGPGNSGWELGASFLAAASQKNITFTATAIDDAILDALEIAAGDRQTVLSGWTFSTTGYTVSTTNPLYLSFDVGAQYPQDDLTIWRYNANAWTEFVPIDLTYDGKYASFTATSLSGYAVTAVPEPGALGLLAAGLLAVLAFGRRKRLPV